MNHLTAVICFAMAAGAAFMGFKGDAFYTGALGRKSTKRIPSWIGRVWFLGGAIVLVYLGVKSLR
jgi:hypothetical protein